MAPEQVRGQDVDARADIWALGVILYELVAGRPPFGGETRSDVMAAILEREIVPLDQLNPALPHELQRIVAKALRKDRAQRYQTITDLRLDLEALRGELQASSLITAPMTASAAPAATTPPPVRRESSAEYILTGLARHKLAAAIALLVIAALATAGAWRMHQAHVVACRHLQRLACSAPLPGSRSAAASRPIPRSLRMGGSSRTPPIALATSTSGSSPSPVATPCRSRRIWNRKPSQPGRPTAARSCFTPRRAVVVCSPSPRSADLSAG